jgi:hypothetical protein
MVRMCKTVVPPQTTTNAFGRQGEERGGEGVRDLRGREDGEDKTTALLLFQRMTHERRRTGGNGDDIGVARTTATRTTAYCDDSSSSLSSAMLDITKGFPMERLSSLVNTAENGGDQFATRTTSSTSRARTEQHPLLLACSSPARPAAPSGSPA